MADSPTQSEQVPPSPSASRKPSAQKSIENSPSVHTSHGRKVGWVGFGWGGAGWGGVGRLGWAQVGPGGMGLDEVESGAGWNVKGRVGRGAVLCCVALCYAVLCWI